VACWNEEMTYTGKELPPEKGRRMDAGGMGRRKKVPLKKCSTPLKIKALRKCGTKKVPHFVPHDGK